MQEQPGNVNNLWVFREGKNSVAAESNRRELEIATAAVIAGPPTKRNVIDALLRAGEFESALSDIDGSEASAAQQLTNLLARCLWDDEVQARKQIPTELRRV